MQPTIADIQAAMRFSAALNLTLGKIVALLGKELGGQFSNETRAAIHAMLRDLDPIAQAVPEQHSSALVGFDLLLAMFPPPDDPTSG